MEDEPLTLSMLGKHTSRRDFEIRFFIFSQKIGLAFHADCLLSPGEADNILKVFFFLNNLT